MEVINPKWRTPTWKWLYRNSFLSTWKLPNLSPWNPRVLYKKCCYSVHGNILYKIYSEHACWISKGGSVQVLILDSAEALPSSEELTSLRILWNCRVINRNWGKYFGAASSTGFVLINELTYIGMAEQEKVGRENVRSRKTRSLGEKGSKYKVISLKMHASEQETFTWPHFFASS